MEIGFRQIEENDLSQVKEIYDWYIQNSTATFHTEPIPIAQLKEFIYLDHPLYKSFVILSQAKVVGYFFLTNYKKRQAYDRTAEVTIYLNPNFRKKGIGKLALDHLESVAKKVGIKNLLGIITGDNEESILLFKRAGYTQCANFKNVGEKFNKILDVVAYQKEL